MSKYTLDYFITKFEAIDEDKWTTGTYADGEGRHCALGHCGAPRAAGELGAELDALDALTGFSVAVVNDNRSGAFTHLGATPKARVVNFLKSLKVSAPTVTTTGGQFIPWEADPAQLSFPFGKEYE